MTHLGIRSSNNLFLPKSQTIPLKGLSNAGIIAMKRLKILDAKGKPRQDVLIACKALKIDVRDLEPHSENEFF